MSFFSKLFVSKHNKDKTDTTATISTPCDRIDNVPKQTNTPIIGLPADAIYSSNETFLFVDVETADCSNDTICAIGCIIIKNCKEYQLYSLINPKTYITNTFIHGISNNDVINAPTLNEYWNTIVSLTGEEFIVVGHNISFDISVLSKDLSRYDIRFSPSRKIDTMAIAKDILYNFSTQSGDLKLDTICRKLNVNLNHHNAESDILATKQILEILITRDNRKISDFINVHYSNKSAKTVGNVRRVKSSEYWDDIYAGRTPVYFTNWHNIPIEENPEYDCIKIEDLQYCSMMNRATCDIKRIQNQVKLIKECVETIGGRIYGKGAKTAKCYIEFYYMDIEEYKKLKSSGYKIYHAIDVENFIFNNQELINNFASEKAKVKAELLAQKEQLRKERDEKREQREKKKFEPKEPAKRKTRKVMQMDDDGNVIATYESLTSAINTTGINSKSIRDCCNGVQKHAGGYVWKYIDTEETEQ